MVPLGEIFGMRVFEQEHVKALFHQMLMRARGRIDARGGPADEATYEAIYADGGFAQPAKHPSPVAARGRAGVGASCSRGACSSKANTSKANTRSSPGGLLARVAMEAARAHQDEPPAPAPAPAMRAAMGEPPQTT